MPNLFCNDLMDNFVRAWTSLEDDYSAVEIEKNSYLSRYFTYQRLIPDQALEKILKFRLKFKLKKP